MNMFRFRVLIHNTKKNYSRWVIFPQDVDELYREFEDYEILRYKQSHNIFEDVSNYSLYDINEAIKSVKTLSNEELLKVVQYLDKTGELLNPWSVIS